MCRLHHRHVYPHPIVVFLTELILAIIYSFNYDVFRIFISILRSYQALIYFLPLKKKYQIVGVGVTPFSGRVPVICNATLLGIFSGLESPLSKIHWQKLWLSNNGFDARINSIDDNTNWFHACVSVMELLLTKIDLELGINDLMMSLIQLKK